MQVFAWGQVDYVEECINLGLDCSDVGRISFKSLIDCLLLQTRNSSALKAAHWNRSPLPGQGASGLLRRSSWLQCQRCRGCELPVEAGVWLHRRCTGCSEGANNSAGSSQPGSYLSGEQRLHVPGSKSRAGSYTKYPCEVSPLENMGVLRNL